VWYWLVVGALVVWRVTHLLNAEDGPWQIFVRLRRAAGDGFFGELLDCFYCLSLWVAAPVGWLLGRTWVERLLLIPALSGAASLLERMTAREAPMPNFIEDVEDKDGVLRQESDPGIAARDDDSDPDGGSPG
jgi:hypothetical protein